MAHGVLVVPLLADHDGALDAVDPSEGAINLLHVNLLTPYLDHPVLPAAEEQLIPDVPSQVPRLEHHRCALLDRSKTKMGGMFGDKIMQDSRTFILRPTDIGRRCWLAMID